MDDSRRRWITEVISLNKRWRTKPMTQKWRQLINRNLAASFLVPQPSFFSLVSVVLYWQARTRDRCGSFVVASRYMYMRQADLQYLQRVTNLRCND
jgi:hypothetical protein